MKKLFTLFIICCAISAKADYWTQRASFPGSNRIGCFGFGIGNKGYIGCGEDTTWATTQTFWEYDKIANVWTQKADFAGSARVYATGFSIGNFGYAGLGIDPAAGWFQDFWKYDPLANTWTAVASYGGSARTEACAFVLNNKAYVGTGGGIVAPYTYNDFWEYDPLANAWTAKASIPNGARLQGLGFAAANHGYVTSGYDGATFFSDLWEYDYVTDTWTQKTNFISDPRAGASGFSLFDKVYVTTGNCHPAAGPAYASKDILKYDPLTNQWAPKTSFGGTPRYEAAYFVLSNKGYLGMGVNLNTQYYDFWEYTPDNTMGVEENIMYNVQCTVFPNPAKEFIMINIPYFKNLEYLTITDVNGKKVYETKLLTSYLRLPISDFQKGIYFVEVSDGKQKAVNMFVKE